jgi:TDG/mug DNA glycosylase family protein
MDASTGGPPNHDLSSVPVAELPAALATHHRSCAPGDRIRLTLPGALLLPRVLLMDMLVGAGFALRRRRTDTPTVLTRGWTLPDTVAPGMRLLVSGLNPSPAAADAGVGFARPGNRFWPAAIRSGLVSVDRDPDHALHHHGLGMTDVVKRTTRRADELDPSEYVNGLARLERLVALFEPAVVCFVGLAGWRSGLDRKATAGWQKVGLGGAPTYLMPSTSGLNASSRLEDFVAHMTEIARRL